MAPHIGGVETHVHEVARRLRSHDVETAVLTTDVSGELAPTDTIDGVPIERVRAWPKRSDYLFAPGLWSRVRSRNWDVVHIQSFHSLVAPVGMAAAQRHHIPYVLTFHGGGHSSRLRTALRRPQLMALRPLLGRSAALVAIADFEIRHYGRLLGLPPDRFVVIPNGSDLPKPSANAPAARGTLIVSSGRLEEYKGHHHAVAALPHIIKRIPDARLWIAGRGPFESLLRTQADELGVADRVEIEAVSDRQAMADRLAGASLGVMLSRFETQPLAALEALSLSVPLVVANNSGLAELVSKNLAVPVELTDSPEAHADVMVRQILAPPPTKDVALPSWDRCAQQLAMLYRAVGEG
jgi:glycosyltransferase involved in cell wall biosynthesis